MQRHGFYRMIYVTLTHLTFLIIIERRKYINAYCLHRGVLCSQLDFYFILFLFTRRILSYTQQ